VRWQSSFNPRHLCFGTLQYLYFSNSLGLSICLANESYREQKLCGTSKVSTLLVAESDNPHTHKLLKCSLHFNNFMAKIQLNIILRVPSQSSRLPHSKRFSNKTVHLFLVWTSETTNTNMLPCTQTESDELYNSPHYLLTQLSRTDV
jgi:hypothetical protein